MLIETVLIGGVFFANTKLGRKYKRLTNSRRLLKKAAASAPVDGVEKNKSTGKSSQNYYRLSIAAVTVTSLSVFAPALRLFSAGMLIFLCFPVVRKAWQQWRSDSKIGHDMLVSMLAGIGLLSNQLFALSIALFFYHLGVKLLAQTQNHSKDMLTQLFVEKPEYVWILREGTEIEIALEQVCLGDQVIVSTGDVIPIDGYVEQGMAMVDQRALTGESQPIEKLCKQKVFASTQVVSGRIIVRVEQTGADTTVAKVADMLENTADYQMSMLSKGEVWADQMAMPLILLSAALSPAIGLVGASAILNSTFGNRLQLTAPLSVLNHLNLATEKGILIKDGRALEKLTKVDTILFDKTGTLTEEEPEVGQIFICAEDYSAHQLLAEAAAAEAKLAHPIARAVIAKAEAEGLELPAIDEADFVIGLGVSVKLDDNHIQVGSLRFMQQHDIVIPEHLEQQLSVSYAQGNSIIFLAANAKLKGALEIQPRLRPGTAQIMQQLRRHNISYLAIVSGDQTKPTEALAEKLGMDACFAETMPEDKAKLVQKLQQEGRTVCFVGDGINDAIAIQAADVSISIDGATHIARDLAQILFMNNGLAALDDLFEIAYSLEHNMQNTLKTLYAPSVVNLFGSLFLGFGLFTTVLTNNASLLLALKETKQHTLKQVEKP